jgi:hypothetical protein
MRLIASGRSPVYPYFSTDPPAAFNPGMRYYTMFQRLLFLTRTRNVSTAKSHLHSELGVELLLLVRLLFQS